jgi:hypothetical protein
VSLRKRALAASIALAIICGAFLLIKIHNSYAESTYMSASVSSDDGQVDFSPGITDAVANFSYKKSGTNGSISNIYDAKITLRNLPEDATKHLSVYLPVGMYWQDDGSNDNYLKSQLDANVGSGGIVKTAVSDAPIMNYAYPNSGTRDYYFQDGTEAVVLSFKIRADWQMDMSYIADAIVASLYIDDTVVEQAEVDVNIPTGASIGGSFYSSSNRIYVNPGADYQSDNGYYRLARSGFVNGQYDVRRPIKAVVFTMQLNDPAAKIALRGTPTGWTIDDSASDEGLYTLTCTFSSLSNGETSIPYSIIIPDDAEGGTVYSLKVSAKTVYASPDGEDYDLAFRNSQNLYFEVLPGSSLVTIGASTLNPTNTNTVIDTSYNSSVYDAADVQGELGRFYINNRGSTESAPLHAKVTFDTSVLGVMNLELVCQPGKVLETIHIKTDSGIEKDVTVNKTCSSTGYAGAINYVAMGLDRFDYIKEVEYDIGVIPAGFQLAHSLHDSLGIAYTGRYLDNSQQGVATLTLTEIDNPENVLGPAKTTTKHTAGAGTLDITNHATQIINAGDTLRFSINVKNWAGGTNYDNTVLSPVLYIRQEVKDAAGNFLPISNLKVVTDSIRGSKDITELFGEITYTDTDTARVYVIDGRNVPDGRASLSGTYVGEDGRVGESTITVSWTISTDLSTPDQQYRIANLFFAQDPNRNAAITTHYMRGDPYGISGNANNTIYAATTNYYQIRGWNAINVENSGKHTTSSDWLTWNEGASPITIGAADGSLADMRVGMSNNSGVSVPGPTTIYVPIPKEGQNWGQLSYHGEDFKFSTTLTGEIDNPNGNYFTIAYGRDVTPTDSGAEIEAQEDKFTTDTSGWTEDDWADVNCVRIVARDIAANAPGTIDTYDFVYSLKVIDVDNVEDGVTDTWRPTYYQQLTNSVGDVFSGWYRGSYVSIKLADGKVSGRLYVDTNEDGIKDSNESYLNEAGWEVKLYDTASGRLARETTTNEQGEYSFIELTTGADSYYAVVTNKHDIESGSTPSYIFAPKVDSDSYDQNNRAQGSTVTTPAHQTARISGITPSKTIGVATYNIGLVEYVETEQYEISLEFNDNDNANGTRPSSVEIDTGNGSMLTISAPGRATYDLPKYDSEMIYWLHTFSAPDIDGYQKEVAVSNNGYKVSIVYNIEKYNLSILHYIEGADTPFSADERECDYGQNYDSDPVDDNRVEFLAVDGDASGIVRDDTTVVYYYKLKRGTVTTHYYIEGTTTKIADDKTDEYDIDDEYTTLPLDLSGDLSRYELVQSPDGTGTVDSLEIEVIYYYREKAQESVPVTYDKIVTSAGIFAGCILGIGAIVFRVKRRA